MKFRNFRIFRHFRGVYGVYGGIYGSGGYPQNPPESIVKGSIVDPQNRQKPPKVPKTPQIAKTPQNGQNRLPGPRGPRARARPGAGGAPRGPPRGGPPGPPREGGFRTPWTPLRLGEFLCPCDQVSRTIRIAETCEGTGDKETRSIATSDCRSSRETLKEGEPEGRRERSRLRNDSDSDRGQDTWRRKR